jgi:hypothetical protein
LRIGLAAGLFGLSSESAHNSKCGRGHPSGYRQKSAVPEPRERVTKHTRRAEARLAENTIAAWCYQVPLERQEPEPDVAQVRVTAPSVPFSMVKLLPDFE